MNIRLRNRIKTVVFYPLVVVFLACILLHSIDRLYGWYNRRDNPTKSITISRGDIIYKINSFIMADTKYPHYGSLPGHLGIILNDTTISVFNNDFEKILVAESSLFNIKEKKIIPNLKIISADNNYKHATGRLFLIKTHLNDNQKEELQQYIDLNRGKPYQLFAEKNDSTSFNCATFVWSAFKYSANIDLDENGGNMVFPTDILKYFMKKERFEIIKL